MFNSWTLDERATAGLLAGRAPRDRDDLAGLASALEDLRRMGDGEPPEPSVALASILAHGVPDGVMAPPVRSGQVPSTRGSRTVKRRRTPQMISALLGGIAAQLSGLGLAGKAALALTATATLAAGAVAADLPSTALEALDRGQQPTVPAAATDGATAPAETPTGGGPEAGDAAPVAPDADEDAGRSEAKADPQGPPATNPANEAAADGLERAREETADTPANVPTQVGPGAGELQRSHHASEAPGQSGDVPSADVDTGPPGSPGNAPTENSRNRPDHTPAGPPTD